jgi:hypothetical protein
MKKIITPIFCVLTVSLLTMSLLAQKNVKPKKPQVKPIVSKTKQIVFAILNYNDGKKVLEPIALVDNGKLIDKDGDTPPTKEPSSFFPTFYKPNATYEVVFGGNAAGKAVVKEDAKPGECSPNMADAAVTTKANLKGNVMALATNVEIKKGSGTRRLPTNAERVEIEKLVKAEFAKEKVAASAIKTTNYHNLTAIDADNDGKVELVGSYYVKASAKTRGLVFFIAEKSAAGKFGFAYKEFEIVKEADVLSGDITALDGGTYNKLLLDSLDVDGDGVGEIFTITQGFEGNTFSVLAKKAGKWAKSFDGGNYHCGY